MTAIRKNIPFREYLAVDAESNSGLKPMGKSAMEYLYRKKHGRDDTKAFGFGRMGHTVLLEPELFDSSYVSWKGGLTKKGEPTMSTNSDAYRAFLSQVEDNGLEVITPEQINTCKGLAAGVKANRAAFDLIEQADKEVSVFWEHRFGIRCKMRADLLHTGIGMYFADLKTCQDASPEGFARAAAKYEYHVQGGMYQEGLSALLGVETPMYIIAAEKVPPYDCAVYEVPQAALDVGKSIFEERLLRVVKCRESGVWPGAQVGVGTLEMPNWVFQDDFVGTIDLSGMEIER